MKKHSLLRFLAAILACILLAGCGVTGQNTTAEAASTEKAAAEDQTTQESVSADQDGKKLHEIREQGYPFYIGSLDTKLTEPYSLYFMDGVDDLPYVELYSWAELLYFLNSRNSLLIRRHGKR